MKRYKFKESFLDDTKEVREQLIYSGAEDYAEWMAFCHCTYLNNKSSYNEKVKDFIKDGLIIMKNNIKIKKLRTADAIHDYIEEVRDRIIKLKGKL